MLVRCLGLAMVLSGCGVPVLVEYEAIIESVGEGAPFGLTGADVGADATGSFGYYSDTPDSNTSEDVGTYRHAGDAPFSAEFVGVTLTGFGNAIVGINNTDPDSFTFADGLSGNYPLDGMTLDGDFTDDVDVQMVLTHNSGVFEDDYLPESWPDDDISHWSDDSSSLVLKYRNGSVTLRFTALRAVAAE